MKQTAVEWLVEQYKKVGGISISMAEIAKAMENEQIIDAYDKGEFNQGCNGDAEQYYNETFNKKA